MAVTTSKFYLLINRMFHGIDGDGINREISSIIESGIRCRQIPQKSLATPGMALLCFSKMIAATNDTVGESMLEVCRGILPTFEYLVGQELSASKEGRKYAKRHAPPPEKRERDFLSVDVHVDMNKIPEDSSIDPRGNDYFCRICHGA